MEKTTGKLTEIVFVLDESGSMHPLTADTIGGFNSVLKKNRDAEGEAFVSTVMFNNESRVVHDRVDIRSVAPLGPRDYQPRGCTALLDAIGGAIKHTDMVQRYLPEGYKADHVLFVITTDGLENASRRYTYPVVKKLIEDHRAMGWDFVFLGANIDVAAEAMRLGIDSGMAVPYSADREGNAAVYEAVGRAAAQVRSCGTMDASWAAPVREDNARRQRGSRHRFWR